MKYAQFSIIITGLIILVFTSQTHAKIDPASIIGIWLFDEGRGDTIKDSSQNSNDGTMSKGCEWVDGKFGTAIEFSDKDEYVKIPPLYVIQSKNIYIYFLDVSPCDWGK